MSPEQETLTRSLVHAANIQDGQGLNPAHPFLIVAESLTPFHWSARHCEQVSFS